MLNPSTADADEDDPTIKRLIKRARAGGFGGIQVYNLCAFRATDPLELSQAVDAIGPDNFCTIMNCVSPAISLPAGGQVVCGWGRHAGHQGSDAPRSMVGVVTDYLAMEMGIDLYCLDITKGGDPVHPLYQSYKKEPRLWMNRQGVQL